MKLSKYFLLLISLAAFSCEPNSIQPESCGIRVKIIHNYCYELFLEIQDEKYFALGDNYWVFDGQKMKPSFSVENICEFRKSLSENDLWNKEFEVTPAEDFKDDCVYCMGTFGHPAPTKSLAVRLCVQSTL